MWDAILKKDVTAFGHHFRMSFEGQVAMFPNMKNVEVTETIEKHKDRALGWKLSGAGGGGYLVLVSEQEIPGTVKIKIRRKSVTG